jgi:hypothetical protein
MTQHACHDAFEKHTFQDEQETPQKHMSDYSRAYKYVVRDDRKLRLLRTRRSCRCNAHELTLHVSIRHVKSAPATITVMWDHDKHGDLPGSAPLCKSQGQICSADPVAWSQIEQQPGHLPCAG